MILDTGKNGLSDGIYYSVAERDRNGRIIIKTTIASQEER